MAQTGQKSVVRGSLVPGECRVETGTLITEGDKPRPHREANKSCCRSQPVPADFSRSVVGDGANVRINRKVRWWLSKIVWRS
jgi:hypothetical protein